MGERCEHLLKSEGVALIEPTLWRAMRALGWTRKKTGSQAVTEYSRLTIHPPKGVKLVVKKTICGDLPSEKKVDATGTLIEVIQSNKIWLPVDNESLRADPAPNAGKNLEVICTVGGKSCKVSSRKTA